MHGNPVGDDTLTKTWGYRVDLDEVDLGTGRGAQNFVKAANWPNGIPLSEHLTQPGADRHVRVMAAAKISGAESSRVTNGIPFWMPSAWNRSTGETLATERST